MSSGINSQTSRTASPRGGHRKQALPKGKGYKREQRDKPDQTLFPVAEAVARLALEKCADQIMLHPVLWTHPERGYKRRVKDQLSRIVLTHGLIDAKRFRAKKQSKHSEVAELVADIIISDCLMKAARCVGDKSKVVMEITSDGDDFLAGMSLGEIHKRRAQRASARAKKAGVASLAMKKAEAAGHPTAYQQSAGRKTGAVA